MAGIIAYGAHIPWLRINRKTISSAMGWFGQGALAGEKAVANHDEDSLSMAVNAGMDCLSNFERESIDGLYFATATAPYKERLNAGIIATALDLRPDISTADLTGSTKAGTTALLNACNTVAAKAARNVMSCAADCRRGRAGGLQEQIYGDAAAAFVIGNDNVIASLEGSYSLSYDFIDHWRSDKDEFDRVWEERYIRDEGYTKLIPEGVSGFLKKYRMKIGDFDRIIYPCPYQREHAVIGKKLGIEPSRIQDPMLNSVGDTGAPHPLIMLAAALDEANVGDKILAVSFGNGVDVLFFQVTEEIGKRENRGGIKSSLASKGDLTSYEKYAAFRNLLILEKGIRGEQVHFTQLSRLWRERKTILALCGSKCRVCGTPQYPAQRVCVNPNCGAVDQMDDYRFSDKKGYLFTYTADNVAYTIDPPQLYGMVNFDGGGRYWFDITDCGIDALKVDMPLAMTFRRTYTDERFGVYGYFWKMTPRRAL